MRAAVLYAPKNLRIEAVADPQPKEDEVLIRVKAAGVCGTDLAVYLGEHPSRRPVILGHEYSGIVEAIGTKVQGVKRGDRVISEASWGCGKCQVCRQEKESLCSQRSSLGRNTNGVFAEKVTVPGRIVLPLQESVSFQEAQSATTVACGIRAIRRAGLREGETVAILGPGHAGLILLQLAAHMGASRRVVFGTRAYRLELAARLGAFDTINIRDETWLEEAMKLTEGEGFDLVIEATGDPSTLAQGLDLVKKGGRALAFSIYDRPIYEFPAQELYNKEVTIIGSKGGQGGYRPALELMTSKVVDVRPLISHRLPLEKVREGLESMGRKEEDVLWVVITL